MSKRASRRRGKEGQELSDIDTGYTSRGLRGAQKEGQEDSERGSVRFRERVRKNGIQTQEEGLMRMRWMMATVGDGCCRM